MKPLLSIIIPCFNCAETLEEAVSSVYASTLDIPFEVVLVNDASTDNTQEVIRTLAEKHSNLRFYTHDHNKGGGATRNTAAAHSAGELIFCLDSDDILPPDTLGRLVAYQRKKQCDGVGISASIKFKGNDPANIAFTNYFGYVGEQVPFESVLERGGTYCPLYSTFLITRKAFDKIGGYPTAHGFDTQGMAWRFLAAGLVAYTCPGATYLHRIQFHESYYLKESNAGRSNYNWQDIFFEHFSLFDESTQEFIRTFDCKNFTKNIFDELRKRDKIFRRHYEKLLGTDQSVDAPTPSERVYIRRDSLYGICLRIFDKLKKNKTFRPILLYPYLFAGRLRRRLGERNRKRTYYEKIRSIIESGEIIVDIEHGGIGDWLAYSSLPRLLSKKYGVKFYVSAQSVERLRNKDTAKLCFELNPYFKGYRSSGSFFTFQDFESDKSLGVFITDRGGENLTEILERQFGVTEKGLPEMYYVPSLIPSYSNVILIDKNMISGERFGRTFAPGAFEAEALKYKQERDQIEYIDPKKQDLFTYVDMIHSCKRFIATFSGGASIAACFNKPFSVLWPSNDHGRGLYLFLYSASQGEYVE